MRDWRSVGISGGTVGGSAEISGGQGGQWRPVEVIGGQWRSVGVSRGQ